MPSQITNHKLKVFSNSVVFLRLFLQHLFCFSFMAALSEVAACMYQFRVCSFRVFFLRLKQVAIERFLGFEVFIWVRSYNWTLLVTQSFFEKHVVSHRFPGNCEFLRIPKLLHVARQTRVRVEQDPISCEEVDHCNAESGNGICVDTNTCECTSLAYDLPDCSGKFVLLVWCSECSCVPTLRSALAPLADQC